ncbi:hypothetical protein SDJN02_23954 [Cucurbita argyrosperma subsp. argyrosperma]|nr:hypothetical protein SDJN02_23954 [Cucurbita argyrosperma subsp. argyrosperma]
MELLLMGCGSKLNRIRSGFLPRRCFLCAHGLRRLDLRSTAELLRFLVMRCYTEVAAVAIAPRILGKKKKKRRRKKRTYDLARRLSLIQVENLNRWHDMPSVTSTLATCMDHHRYH